MMEELQLRNLSPITADTYLHVVERFARTLHVRLRMRSVAISGGTANRRP
jgi:hypothetical protein